MLTKNKKHVNRRWLNCTFVVMVALAALIMLGVDGCPTPWPGPPQHLWPPQGIHLWCADEVKLSWLPVAGAVEYGYKVEIPQLYPSVSLFWVTYEKGKTTLTYHNFNFFIEEGIIFRWCVWAIDDKGVEGPKSDLWYSFIVNAAAIPWPWEELK